MSELGGSNRSYPAEWGRHLVLDSGWKVFARPIKAADESSVLELLSHVSKDDLRLRFFASIKKFSHAFLVSLTALDYTKAMAFIAFDETTQEPLGVVRMHLKENNVSGEYAILLRSDLKGRGLGWALMQLIIEYSHAEGLNEIVGQVLRENTTMLQMCRELGFRIKVDPDDNGIYDVSLAL